MFVFGQQYITISAVANFDFVDKQGRTALHVAAQYDDVESAYLLIMQKININQLDNQGQTALHCAAEFNSGKVAELLLDAGADRSLKDNNGMTPLAIAFKNKSDRVIPLMSNIRLAKIGIAFLAACLLYLECENDFENMQNFLDDGVCYV